MAMAVCWLSARKASKAVRQIEIQLIPLERIAEPIFDLSQLPVEIAPGVEVADVSALLPPSEFEYMQAEVGRHQLRYFTSSIKYGLVHRYELPVLDDESASKNKTDLLNNVFCLLRLIRPHRSLGGFNGTISPAHPTFTSSTSPLHTLDVPHAL